MKKFTLFTFAISFFCLMSCTESEEFTPVSDVAKEIQLDGNCDIYSLENEEGTSWIITSNVDWILPVNDAGNVSDAIQLYVESNSRVPLRSGIVNVTYSNGVTKSTTVKQTNEQTETGLQRAYAAGWGG